MATTSPDSTVRLFTLQEAAEALTRAFGNENRVSETTSTDSSVRLFTIQEAAEELKLPISWLYERTRRNAIPFRRLGKYVRFTQKDLAEIISSTKPQRRHAANRK